MAAPRSPDRNTAAPKPSARNAAPAPRSSERNATAAPKPSERDAAAAPGPSEPRPAAGASDPFAAVQGQPEAVALLRRAVAGGRVAHAYAFVGPPGSGRKLTALCLAKALVAPDGGPAAGRVERGVHPDVRLIEPTPPEGNPKGPLALRIDSIRGLERLATLRPVEAPWKVFIVDEAERMTLATPQAFLKTLEEPPDRTVIVLILSQLRMLPATVLSRCQVVRFGPRSADGRVALLPDGSDEGRRRALAMLAEVELEGPAAVLRVGEAVGRDRRTAEVLVEACWLWQRDLLCSRAGAASRLAVFDQIEKGPSADRSIPRLLGGLAACRDAWIALQGNVSPRLTVEVLLDRLAREAA